MIRKMIYRIKELRDILRENALRLIYLALVERNSWLGGGLRLRYFTIIYQSEQIGHINSCVLKKKIRGFILKHYTKILMF